VLFSVSLCKYFVPNFSLKLTVLSSNSNFWIKSVKREKILKIFCNFCLKVLFAKNNDGLKSLPKTMRRGKKFEYNKFVNSVPFWVVGLKSFYFLFYNVKSFSKHHDNTIMSVNQEKKLGSIQENEF
jgi:hypothetical protein